MPRKTALLLLFPALLCATPACESPLGRRDAERGLRVPPSRVREAERLPLESYAATDDRPAQVSRQRPNLYADARLIEATIEQCRAWTLEHNLDLKVALMDPEIAETAISEEEAAFESTFVGRVAGSEADRSRSLVFPDGTPDPFEFDAGVRIPLRTGGFASVRVPVSREETFPGAPGDNRWSTDIEASVSLPLLRNAGRWTNSHFIRIASLQTEATRAQTKLEVIRLIAATDRAYWLLYEANEILKVRLEQLDQAFKQLEQAEQRFRGAVGARIDVVRAEAGVSRRLVAIINTELAVKDRQRELKRLVNLPGADVDSEAMFVLTSTPDPVRYRFAPEEMIDTALRTRMEMLELELRLAQDASTIDFAQNQKLPLLTLDYTYRFDGFGDSFDRSVNRLARVESDGWIVGLSAEVPLGNAAAEARAHRALLTRLQRLATRSAREQAIKQEVLAALDYLEASWQRIIAARQNAEAEAANYRAEQGQYQIGLRNSTEVLDAEARLSDARAAEYSALVDYQIAQVDLAFAVGMLLGAAKVSW
jgi:outer membrane protein TolC